jgi:hypothetical protein
VEGLSLELLNIIRYSMWQSYLLLMVFGELEEKIIFPTKRRMCLPWYNPLLQYPLLRTRVLIFFIIKQVEATYRGGVPGQAPCRKTSIKQGENPV